MTPSVCGMIRRCDGPSREGHKVRAASPSQMGRFEKRWLAVEKNLSALADLSGRWIDRVHSRRPPRGIFFDMDSSVSPTHGAQEKSCWNGHYECSCYHPLFLFNQFGDLERCALRPGNVHSTDGWEGVLSPRVGFIVTNMARRAENVIAFYNKRGTCEQWIKEGKGAQMDTAFLPLLRCQRRAPPASCARLQPR